MAQMIVYEGNLIRINPKDSYKLEISRNDGRNWSHHCTVTNSVGEFQDLTDNGKEILANTTRGLYVSKNGGKNWSKRG